MNCVHLQQYYGWGVTSNGIMWAAVSGTATLSFVLLRFVAKYAQPLPIVWCTTWGCVW